MIPTITDIAWLFLNEKHEKEAAQFAEIALELNDIKAEEIVREIEENAEEENDSLYAGEINHMRDKHLFNTRRSCK